MLCCGGVLPKCIYIFQDNDTGSFRPGLAIDQVPVKQLLIKTTEYNHNNTKHTRTVSISMGYRIMLNFRS